MANPISIVSQNIYKPYSTAPTSWALCNPMDRLKIVTRFKVQVVAISSSNTPITLNKTDGLIGAGWVYDPNNQFENFNIGDSVIVWNYGTGATMDASNFTITDKQGNGLIQLDHAVPTVGNDYVIETVTISNKTAITSVKYKYNFIKNYQAPTFISPVDEISEQTFIIDYKLASDTASSNMRALGGLEWQDGIEDGGDPVQAVVSDFATTLVYPATIEGVSIDTGGSDGIYKATFQITHYTKLPPFFLYQQNEPPYSGDNCLKFIYQIEVRPVYTNPNVIQSVIYNQTLGNTGWYDENFNSGITNYKITNLTYAVGGDPVDAVELSANETIIEFDVENTTDSPFISSPTANFTRYSIGFHKIPADPSEYQETGLLKDINFCFDYLQGGVDASALDGFNYLASTGYGILRGYTVTKTSASKIHVKVGVEMEQAVIDLFTASNTPKYALTFQVREYALATNVGDDVTLLVANSEFSYDTEDLTMIGFDIKNRILRHPDSDVTTDGVQYPTDVNVFPEDELTAYTPFYIDSNGRTSDEIILTQVKCEIIATGAPDVFVLDSFSVDLSNYPLVGYAQFFDINIADQFHIPVAEELRKYYRIMRRSDLDAGGKYYFSANYPFLMRWETWVQALGVDPVFFDQTLPNNGFNQWWYRYGSGSYQLYYRITIKATKNGVPQEYEQKQAFDFNDYSSNADFTAKTIKTYNLAGVEQTSGGVKYISGFENTEIRAVFSNINTPNTGADIYTAGVVVIGIEALESGGIGGKRRYSSLYPADSDTWFTYFPNNVDKVKLSSAPLGGGGHTVTARCYIDYTKLPVGVNQFKITARIYDNIAGTFQEECITQDVTLIPADPELRTSEITIPTNPNPGCCNDYVITVLADSTGIESQNDISGVLNWFEPIVTGATMSLKKWNGSAFVEVDDLTTNACGTKYAFGFFTNTQNQNFIGYQIEWANVLDLYGTGSYRIDTSYTVPLFDNQVIEGYEYCLREYSSEIANGTVKLEYWLNGITGDIFDDTKYKDFGTINWYNSLRVRGFFGYPTSQYKSEDIEYNNGQNLFVEDTQEPVYDLKLKLLPFFLHEIIKTDFMQADRLAITDYNSRNNETYIRKYVRKNSGYEPRWYPLQSNLASVDLKFKPEFNRFRKLR